MGRDECPSIGVFDRRVASVEGRAESRPETASALLQLGGSRRLRVRNAARTAFQICDEITHLGGLRGVRTVVKLQTGAVCIAAMTGIVCVLLARCGATGQCWRGGARHVGVTHVI